MTLSEFKAELDAIRNNNRAIHSILDDLSNLTEDYLAIINAGAIDYSKDRLQSSPDPDAPIINVIDRRDRKKEQLEQKLTRLEEANAFLEAQIMEIDEIGGEVLRLFYIETLSMKKVAAHLNYTERYCWKLWRETIRNLYEKVRSHYEAKV